MSTICKLLWVSSLIVLISSCHTIRPQGAQPAGGDYDQFFLGDNQFQYFIKPISFASETSTLSLDITFRHPDTADSAIVNFTLKTDQQLSRARAIQLKNNKDTIQANKLNIIYQRSPSSGNYEVRYSSRFTPEEVIQQLGDPDWKVMVSFEGEEQEFEAERRTRRVLNRLKSRLYRELTSSSEFFSSQKED